MPDTLELTALTAFWKVVAGYATWVLESTERAHTSEYALRCPRIGVQQAARTFLAAWKSAAKRRKWLTLSLPHDTWTWLARGFYESHVFVLKSNGQPAYFEWPPTGCRRPLDAGLWLGQLLCDAQAFPTYHGLTRIDLREWVHSGHPWQPDLWLAEA